MPNLSRGDRWMTGGSVADGLDDVVASLAHGP
jgi:hypothetical protein